MSKVVIEIIIALEIIFNLICLIPIILNVADGYFGFSVYEEVENSFYEFNIIGNIFITTLIYICAPIMLINFGMYLLSQLFKVDLSELGLPKINLLKKRIKRNEIAELRQEIVDLRNEINQIKEDIYVDI